MFGHRLPALHWLDMETSHLIVVPRPADAGRLAALGRQTFVETFGGMYDPADERAFLEQVYSESAIRAELLDPRLDFRVLEQDGEWLGFVKIGALSVPVTDADPSALELRQLYLLRPYTGKGLGRVLMDWADAEFARRGASGVYVSVFSGNLRAIRFYERRGFQKTGEYGFRVGNHVDREWIMYRPGSGCSPRSSAHH